MLNHDFELKNLGYSTADSGTDLPRHRWYHFKEAFSPHIVDSAIWDSRCKKGDLVVDPFCGSGTVVTAATFAGLDSVSCEINPFFKMMAESKLQNVKSINVQNQLKVVEKGIGTGKKSPLENVSTFSESKGLDKWLFNTDVLRAFEGGWQASEDIPNASKKLVRLSLLGAAMDSCNAVRDGKCLRYRNDWKKQNHSKKTFASEFSKRMLMITEDLSKSKFGNGKGRVHLGDARNINTLKLKRKFKLCVTSPPYLNSFDYSDVYRPELFLGKFVDSNSSLMKLRLKTLRSHVQARWELPTESDFGSLYASVFQEVEKNKNQLWDKRIPTMIQAYFQDMKSILRDLRIKALPDARMWIVVSTSAYAGIHIPVDLILAEIGGRVGWKLREIGVLRNLRCSQQHLKRVRNETAQEAYLRESVVILEAANPQKTR